MAMRFISSSWKEDMYNSVVSNERIYIDFRRDDYLPVASSPTYTLVTSSDNQPGSHYLSGGSLKYLYTLPDELALEMRFKPQFTYDVAADQILVQWYESATEYFKIYYNATDDKFVVEWQDGGTARTLESQQFDDGTSHEDIDQWITLTLSADLTTGDTTGAALYINRVSQDTTWSGDIDSPTINKVELDINTADNYDIAYMRFFDGIIVTATDVSNAFRDVKAEELYFNFDGNAIGRLRCNVNRFVKSWNYSASAENDGGSQTANRAGMTLYNLNGEFADDQYAAFDPENDLFNGTSSQKYLRQRCGVFIESWYGTNFEPLFIGYLDESRFPRNTRADKYSEVTIGAEDYIAQIAHKFKDRPVYYENKDIADTADEDNSLIHLITRLATQRTFYNYIADSSFETDSTPGAYGSSWVAGNCTITRDSTYTFCGTTYSGKVVYSAGGTLTQYLRFYDTTTGQEYASWGSEPVDTPYANSSWILSTWVRSDSSFTGTLSLESVAADGITSTYETTAISLTGSEGWQNYQVEMTLTHDTARFDVEVLADSGTIYLNGFTLTPGKKMYNAYIQNDTERSGSVGYVEYVKGDNVESDSVNYCGFDVESFDVQHPWVLIKEQTPIWEEVKAIGDAVAARYCGMDKAGTFRLRSAISGTDPSTLETVSAVQNVATQLESQTANKIIVHGVKITKSAVPQTMWIMSASSIAEDLKDEGDIISLVLTNGYWPEDGDNYQLWAKYGEV